MERLGDRPAVRQEPPADIVRVGAKEATTRARSRPYNHRRR
jgi:hypothetical protein